MNISTFEFSVSITSHMSSSVSKNGLIIQKDDKKDSNIDHDDDDDGVKVNEKLQEAFNRQKKLQMKVFNTNKKLDQNLVCLKDNIDKQLEEVHCFFNVFTMDAIKAILELSDKNKKKMKDFYEKELASYEQTNKQIKEQLNNLVKQGPFQELVDNAMQDITNVELYDKNRGETPTCQVEEKGCDTGCQVVELNTKISTLMRKYKLLKYSMPSLFSHEAPLKEIIDKEMLLEYSDHMIGDLNKSLETLNNKLIKKLGSIVHPFKSSITAIEKLIDIKSSEANFSFDLSLPNSDNLKNKNQEAIPASSIKETLCKFGSNEESILRKTGLFLKDEELKVICPTNTVSIHYHMKVNDLMLFNNAPHRIADKQWSFPSDHVVLENVLTGVNFPISFHSRWHQQQDQLFPKQYLLSKVKEDYGLYVLESLKDQSTKIVDSKSFVGHWVKQDIKQKAEDEMVILYALVCNGKEVVVDSVRFRIPPKK